MAVRYDDVQRRLVLGVRDLIEGGRREGHLQLRPAWTLKTRAAAGREVHRVTQAWRAEHDAAYTAEVSVKTVRVVRGWECTIRGRLDGLTVEAGHLVVEEIKSTALPAERLYVTSAEDWPYWQRQVALYLWLLDAMGRPAQGRLVLVSLVDGSRHVVSVRADLVVLEAQVTRRLEELVFEREDHLAWLQKRREALVPFAHDVPRAGQEALIQVVYDALEGGQQLLLSAPTGTGKTAAVLQATLRHAWGCDRRVFFATAKGTQSTIVEQTLAAMADRGLPLRAVSIRGRERLCLRDEGVDCRAEVCEFATDYHEKLRENKVLEGALTQICDAATLLSLGRRHRVCPHALAMEVARRADVIVGDYNYAFDPDVRLALLDDDHWVLVVDEAHNLVGRARDYGSGTLSAQVADQVADHLRSQPGNFEPYARLCEVASELIRDCGLRIESEAPRRGWEAVVAPPKGALRDLRDQVEELALAYALTLVGGAEDPYTAWSWSLLRFVRRLESAGEETVYIYGEERGRGSTLRMACLDPAPLMGPCLDGFKASVLLSATLRPAEFHRDLLGLQPGRLQIHEAPSPFPPENRRVLLATRISTAYRDRASHRERTAGLIEAIVGAVPGNVAVYYSSFAFLASLEPLIAHPDRTVLIQERGMNDAARKAIVEAFCEVGATCVLHAVSGGILAEGVDWPGGVLRAVVVVGPALPAVSLERSLHQAWCQERYGRGFSYAFWVPGLSRVVQAAGRVIRSPDERGIVVLVGRRFAWREPLALLPADWSPTRSPEPWTEVEAFFQG
jgi:DNA excision repair protein ERCC-2